MIEHTNPHGSADPHLLRARLRTMLVPVRARARRAERAEAADRSYRADATSMDAGLTGGMTLFSATKAPRGARRP